MTFPRNNTTSTGEAHAIYVNLHTLFWMFYHINIMIMILHVANNSWLHEIKSYCKHKNSLYTMFYITCDVSSTTEYITTYKHLNNPVF